MNDTVAIIAVFSVLASIFLPMWWFLDLKDKLNVDSILDIFRSPLASKEFSALTDYILGNLKRPIEYTDEVAVTADKKYEVRFDSIKNFRINGSEGFSVPQKMHFIRKVKKHQAVHYKTVLLNRADKVRSLLNQEILDKMVYEEVDKIIK